MKFALTVLGFLLPSLVMASDIAEDNKPRLTFQLGTFIPKEYPDFEPVTVKAQLAIAGLSTTDEKVIQNAEEALETAKKDLISDIRALLYEEVSECVKRDVLLGIPANYWEQQHETITEILKSKYLYFKVLTPDLDTEIKNAQNNYIQNLKSYNENLQSYKDKVTSGLEDDNLKKQQKTFEESLRKDGPFNPPGSNWLKHGVLIQVLGNICINNMLLKASL